MQENTDAKVPRQLDLKTELALDRTLLSWIRTSLTLTGFGFTLAKFVNDLIDKGILHGVASSYPRQVGFGLMILGFATLLGGAFEYVRIGKTVRPGRFVWSVSLVLAVGLAVLSVFLILSLAAELKLA